MKQDRIKIAFIMHPLNVDEFFRKTFFYYPFDLPVRVLLKVLPLKTIKNLFSMIPPHVFFKSFDINSLAGARVSFSAIMCPMFPQEVVLNEERAINKVLSAVKLAVSEGNQVIVLAGFTSIIGNQGEIVRGLINRRDIAITSGNSLTAALCIHGIKKAADLFSVELANSTVAIIGATGDIGSAITKAISKSVRKTNVCARRIFDSSDFVEWIKKQNSAKFEIFNDPKHAIQDADVVVVATSSVVPIFSSSDFKAKSIICDASLPYNLSSDLINRRKDVFAFDGGKARINLGENIVDSKWNKFTRSSREIYGCLAEGMSLAFENKIENFSIGRGEIGEDKMNYILMVAQKHGFELQEFCFHGKPYSDNEIKDIKKEFLGKICS